MEGAVAFGDTERVYHCGGFDFVEGFEGQTYVGSIKNHILGNTERAFGYF
jgi:hypothetical protein